MARSTHIYVLKDGSNVVLACGTVKHEMQSRIESEHAGGQPDWTVERWQDGGGKAGMLTLSVQDFMTGARWH